MIRVESRLGQPLEDWLADRYQSMTQEQITAALKVETGLKVSGATVSRWMRELDIETRLPGQRPPAEAVA